MKEQITQRVEAVRQYLRDNDLHAFIFPSTDPHCGEYIPDHWKTRQWVSGFDGSAGTAVVTLDDAALWTDSRYFLAAEEQLEDTPFTLMKQGVEGTPTIDEWLGRCLDEGDVVGIDPWVNTIDSVNALEAELMHFGIEVKAAGNPADELWKDRPALSGAPIEIQPLELCGLSAHDKIELVRSKMTAEVLVITQLDEIAWLLNLRGSDVHCNPVFVSYVVITAEECHLYVELRKVSPKVAKYLEAEGVDVRPYSQFKEDLQKIESDVQLNPATANYAIYDITSEMFVDFVASPSIIAPLKAVKTEAEITGMRNAMLRDGVAMVRFLKWLKPAVEAGGETEMSIDRRLTTLRAAQDKYRDISFDTIAGYAHHGAIVHYEATPETDIELEPRGLLLLDSGAQYQDGTTDITRTIALGELTEEERHDYTLVLRGHIRLAMVKFPSGSSGTQLDVCARYAMWQEGINYLHGTGHGVGSYLNVHEGPHQIRMNYMPAPLVAGMTVTNEPGIYRAGKHGVRIENTMLITHYCQGEYGEFLQLEPLTLCPIDTAPINLHEMQQDEIDYLNWYHQHVYDTLSPHLTPDEAAWLKEACKPL